MPALPSVSVCFPAYNEGPNVAAVLESAHGLLADSGLDYEILVCDDGSTDGTAGIINDITRRRPRMRAIYHASNQGIRATFEHLYREASKEFVFLNSTDGQWETRILLDLLPLTREWDVIIATRRDKHYRFTRSVVSWGFNEIPRLLFGVRTRDAGAVKLVRREIIERFALVSRSPFSEAERLVRAARAGYRITDHPVETSVRRTGRSRGVSAHLVFAALMDVARVWRALRTQPAGANVAHTPVSESSNADRQ